MRIVAIETSGRHGSVAALSGETGEAQLLRQIALGDEQRTAQALAPALRQLLSDVSWAPRSVEMVAVAVGPGSFTGLRIGVTTAKTFAYAVGAKVIGVNTLAVLAAQAPASSAPLWTIVDAQRQELFVAKFNTNGHGDIPIDCDTSIVPQDIWLAQLRSGDRVIGPALRRLASRLPEGVVAVAEEFWQPMAAAVGRVAWQAYQAGRRDDVWKLAPHYYRPSAAEEKLS
jgi:tRNA threonylcarbamoyladenosine biosynthesis protein TsaB